jgi:RNA polymerase sigma-70 factor (ECF subfamily)
MEYCTGNAADVGSACSAASTWDDVARLHFARVYRHAYRLTGNRPDAEDLTQEVFIRVFRNLADYTPGTFEGWLYRITTNLFRDWVRRRRHLRLEPLPDTVQAAGGSSPDLELEARTFEPDLRSALDALTPGFLAVIVLHDVDGFTYEEIAVALGIQSGTVASRLHRARAQLRAALSHRKIHVTEGNCGSGPHGSGRLPLAT